MLFATDRPTAAFNTVVALFADPNSVTLLPGRQRENTPYAASPGSSGLMTNLWTGADATMRHLHISGGRAFSHCHNVRPIASGSVSAERGEFLRTLLVGARPAMVVARRGRSL